MGRHILGETGYHLRKIMLIRHGEKHTPGSPDRGITADGRHAKHELTVRGWQRAGALVGHFAPPGGMSKNSKILTPRAIFASNATKKSPSKRAMHTVWPLADFLRVPVHHELAEDQEEELAPLLLKAPSPVLVVWHHGNIPALARAIAGPDIPCPDEWPDDRFDVTWILDRADGRSAKWKFSQAPQCLLPGDSPTVF